MIAWKPKIIMFGDFKKAARNVKKFTKISEDEIVLFYADKKTYRYQGYSYSSYGYQGYS